jgi:hypothetical protein
VEKFFRWNIWYGKLNQFLLVNWTRGIWETIRNWDYQLLHCGVFFHRIHKHLNIHKAHHEECLVLYFSIFFFLKIYGSNLVYLIIWSRVGSRKLLLVFNSIVSLDWNMSRFYLLNYLLILLKYVMASYYKYLLTRQSRLFHHLIQHCITFTV